MKRIIFLISIVFILCCSNEKKGKTLNVGVILPLTGNAAFIGQPLREGIRIGINEFNKGSNNKIHLIFEDGMASPSKSISSYEKLKSQNIKIIIGPASSGVSLALKPLADKDSIILFSPSASTPKLSNKIDFFYRNELAEDKGGYYQGKLAFDTLKWKRGSIIYINDDYGKGIFSSFSDSYENFGGTINLSMAYNPGTTNFKSILIKLKSLNNDFIFIIAENDYSLIIKQIRELGIESPIYATPVFENQRFIEDLGKYSENVIYTYYGMFGQVTGDSLQSRFIQSYINEYNKLPNYYSALGYENSALLTHALALNNYKIDSELRNIIKQIKNYHSVTGIVSINKFGDIDKPVILKKVVNRKFMRY